MASTPLPAALQSLLSLELQSLHSHIIIYCDDIVETVPSLRQFTAVTVFQTLLRNQVIWNYLI